MIVLLFTNVWEQTGVIMISRALGSTIGPPADRLYAVEPVGVEIIMPSALYVLSMRPFT